MSRDGVLCPEQRVEWGVLVHAGGYAGFKYLKAKLMDFQDKQMTVQLESIRLGSVALTCPTGHSIAEKLVLANLSLGVGHVLPDTVG